MKAKIWTTELQAEIRRCFSYDPCTGIVEQTASFSHKGPDALGPVSNRMVNGYLGKKVTFNGKRMWLRAHRIAWFLMTGIQTEQIDHRNHNRADNRWENIREATHGQNNHNRKKKAGRHRDLPVGVTRWVNKRTGLWFRGYIRKDGKDVSKEFRMLHDAIAWRQAKSKELFGEFAPANC